MSKYLERRNEEQKNMRMNESMIETATSLGNVTMEFSLLEESREKTEDELLREISEAIYNGEVLIPWCNKVEKISINHI